MVQSIDRALQIVQILVSDDYKTTWSISELAEKTGLPLSTVHRLISSLMKYRLVDQVPETKQYKAGYAWMEIGLRMLENIDYRAVIRPVMQHLATEVQESVYFSIPSGTDAIVIERVDSPSNVRVIDNLGIRIPLHIGAANKTMLANMAPDEVNDILNDLITSDEKKQTLLSQLMDVKRMGYAVSYGEKTEGTASVAAPVLGFNDKVVGALSIGVLSYRITDDKLALLISKVKEAAEEVSIQIGKRS